MDFEWTGPRLEFRLDNGHRGTIHNTAIQSTGCKFDQVIETVFLLTKIPFIRILGNFQMFTALCIDRDANKLLKVETKNILKKNEYRYKPL